MFFALTVLLNVHQSSKEIIVVNRTTLNQPGHKIAPWVLGYALALRPCGDVGVTTLIGIGNE